MKEITFAASWTEHNHHLQSRFLDILKNPFLTNSGKISLCFHRAMEWLGRMLTYPAHYFAKKYIVRGTSNTREQIQQINKEWRAKWEETGLLQKAYEPTIIKGTAPNGDPIEGTLYRSKRSTDNNLPTILCLNPNPDVGGPSRTGGWDWLLRKGIKSPLPFHVLVFDYASCAAQGGALNSPDDLVLNADTFYQFAVSQGISESNIHFFGYCAGAHTSASLAAMHPLSGRCVSFNASYNLAELIYHSSHIRIPRPLKKIVHFYLTWSKWSMDVRQELDRISNRTLFIQHAADTFVTPEARYTHIANSTLNSLLLETKENVSFYVPLYPEHWHPISCTEDGSGLSGTKNVVNFLLGQQVFYKTIKTDFST